MLLSLADVLLNLWKQLFISVDVMRDKIYALWTQGLDGNRVLLAQTSWKQIVCCALLDS